MEDLQMKLLIDLHRSNFRQGPGGADETKQALILANEELSQSFFAKDFEQKESFPYVVTEGITVQKYHLLSRIGCGGMAQVFKAVNTTRQLLQLKSLQKQRTKIFAIVLFENINF